MVVGYRLKDNAFEPENPRLWSTNWLASIGLTPNYDLAPDGERFAVLMPAQAPTAPQRHVTLIVNFFDEVRRRIPVAN
jgi:serine/threonine-protein kinase